MKLNTKWRTKWNLILYKFISYKTRVSFCTCGMPCVMIFSFCTPFRIECRGFLQNHIRNHDLAPALIDQMVWYVIFDNCVSCVHAQTHTFYKNVCDYVYVRRIRLHNQLLKMYDCKPCIFCDTQNRPIHYQILIWYVVCTTASIGLSERRKNI